MDFIYSHPKIFEFLSDYPKTQWPDLIIAAILNGIPYTKPPPESSSLPLLRQQLNSMKEELEKLNKSLDEPQKSLKVITKRLQPEQKTPKKKEIQPEETPRFSKQNPPKSISPSRSLKTEKSVSPLRRKSINSHKHQKPPSRSRQIPRYLKNVDSKIRPEVQKDIAHYKSLIESVGEESVEKSSLSLLDLSNKDTRKSSQGRFFESSMSKSNSFEVRLTNTLEGTFTNQEIMHKAKPSNEIPVDRDFETPRYPSEIRREPEILEIAENFLAGPLMAELCLNNGRDVDAHERCVKSQQIPPLDLLSNDEQIVPFRKRWEEATKDIGKKGSDLPKSKDFRMNTSSREFLSGRSSAMMMVQTPSPIPYDEKFGPMCQDASYIKY